MALRHSFLNVNLPLAPRHPTPLTSHTPHRATTHHRPLGCTRGPLLHRVTSQASASPYFLAPEVTQPPEVSNSPNPFKRLVAWWTLTSPTPHEAAVGEKTQQGSEMLPLIRKMWALCKGESVLIVSALAFLLAAAACELCIPHFATKCIFAAGEVKSQALLAGYIKTLAILVGLYGASSAIRGMCFTVLNNRMIRRLRGQLFQRLIRRETAFFDATDTGALTSRLQSDCQAVAKCVATNLNIALRNFIQAAGGAAYLYFLSRSLFFTTMGISSLLWAVTLAYGNYSRRTQKVYQDVLAASNSVAEEALSLSRVVRTFGTEEREERRYGSWLQRLYDVGLRQASGYGLFVMIGHAATYSSKVVALLLGCAMVLQGTLTAEQLTNFIFYVEFVTYASLNVCDEFTEVMEVLGASERVLKLLDAEPAPQIAPGQQLASFSGRIDFENVTFSYANRPNQAALGGVSLALRPGKVVALVGLSGSGKTTLVALLQRLYDPAGGRVLVDGVDLRDLDANWYRSQIGVVTQEPRLFSTSIAENIAYGCEHRPASGGAGGSAGAAGTPSMDEIVAAAKASNAHAFIMALPQGYDTHVSDKLLSGGQKQRIALARALVRRPRLLVLDEATSALDADSESQVQQALDRAMAVDDRAVVVIAHRLTTVRNADTIVVMDRGMIAEQGNHEQLMALEGIYWQLVCRQLLGIDPTSPHAAAAMAAATSSGALRASPPASAARTASPGFSEAGSAYGGSETNGKSGFEMGNGSAAAAAKAEADAAKAFASAFAAASAAAAAAAELQASAAEAERRAGAANGPEGCPPEDGGCSDTERDEVQHWHNLERVAEEAAETDVEREMYDYQT